MKIKLLHFSAFTLVISAFLSFQLKAQVASFSASPNSGCAPLSVTFTNNSTGATSYTWDFGNGNTAVNPTPPVGATYLSAGTYTVTLTASNGTSSNSTTLTITAFSKPASNFSTNVTTTTCVGEAVAFTDTSIPGSGTINSWHWDFGDGTNQNSVSGVTSHAYVNPGTYPASLLVTDNNGCFTSIIDTIMVLAAPVASFTGSPLFSCAPPLTVNFTNASTSTGSVSYTWDFGDGSTSTQTNPSHTYTSSGIDTVRLIIVQGGCTDTIIKNSYVVIRNTVADFSVSTDSVCLGQSVSFTDSSIPLSISRTWDFGDGATSTAANPTHTYATAGTYTVSLLNATDANGCSDDTIKVNSITIFPSTVAAFTADTTQSCSVPFTVNFTDNSVNATSWLWNFGDGNTSIFQNPTHTYLTPGSDTVTLVSTNANGCVDTIIKLNYILISPPVAQFTATPRQGCIPLTVNFTSTSISQGYPILNYDWDFGDGNVISTATPTTSNVYTTTGFFTIRLIITTASGCKDTIIRTNYVKAGSTPTADFNIVDSTVCFGFPTLFNDLSATADSAYWLFGDGASLSLYLPSTPVSHTYGDTGTFTVTQTVYYNGCPDTIVYDDIATILPSKPQFTYQLNCINHYSVSFTDASVGADSITWDFGDGTFDNTNNLNPTHLYLSRGLKTVILTSFNYMTGCSFSFTASFTIAEPIAQFTSTPQFGCYPLSVTLGNSSQDANTRVWSFGDGTPNSTFINPPVHVYSLPGTDTVKLIITDVNFCKDTAAQVIHVLGPVPFYSASVLTGCAPLPVTFTDSSVSDSLLVQWNWNFGDGSLAQNTTIPSINYTYTIPGLHTVTMTVTDTNGCAKILVKTNYIEPTFPFPSVVADTFACKNELVTFDASATSVAAPAVYSWNFGDGSIGTGAITTHSYISDNLYTITLTVTDRNGCDSTIQHQLLIQQPHAAFKDTVLSEGCGFTNMQFTDLSTGVAITGWHWNFGDGASSTQQNPSHSYTTPGIYNVFLVVTNSAGCTDSIGLDSIAVVPGPFGTFSFTPTSGCNPLSVNFTASSNNSTTYTWDFGDGTVVSTTNSTVNHIYTNDITATPILLLGNILSNGSACQLPAPSAGQVIVSTIINVAIDSAQVTLTQDEEFIINSTFSNISGAPSYSWTPEDGLSCTTCQTPIIIGNGSGQNVIYVLTITDPASGGCIGSDSILVIFPLCANEFTIPNIFTPNEDGVNDLFEIKGVCETSVYSLHIYDRWGIEIFLSGARKLAWDGRTTSGMKASEGVYYYFLTLDGETQKGFLHLLR